MISKIKSGEKLPLYAKWKDCYNNIMNLEHWINNKLKAYMYFIGLISVTILPFVILIDCFFPIFGRGPSSKKKEEDKEKEKDKEKKKNE